MSSLGGFFKLAYQVRAMYSILSFGPNLQKAARLDLLHKRGLRRLPKRLWVHFL
jgi:hypothetical protein